jgi:ADP-ribose pyrophosphatase
VERFWETSERCVDHGSVLIIACLKPSDRLVVIRQYRPPAERFVYEFPAGLVDDGETAAEAAGRELREETGYTACRLEVSEPGYTSPGMTNDAVALVLAEIDETAPENATLRTEFDPSENIETILVPRAELAAFHRAESSRGNAFDAKLAAYIIGLCGL